MRTLRRIMEDALATLPPTEASERIKSQARASSELRIADSLSALQLTTEAWRCLCAGLDIDAGIMLNPRNRASIVGIVGEHAATLPSPVATANRLWQELLRSLDRHGIRHPSQMRQLLADVYWEVAIAQRRGIGGRAGGGGAAYANCSVDLCLPAESS